MSSWLGALAIDERGGLPSIYDSCPLMAKELKGKRQPIRAYLRQCGRWSLMEAVMKKGGGGLLSLNASLMTYENECVALSPLFLRDNLAKRFLLKLHRRLFRATPFPLFNFAYMFVNRTSCLWLVFFLFENSIHCTIRIFPMLILPAHLLRSVGCIDLLSKHNSS
jgi:hypothetical protein